MSRKDPPSLGEAIAKILADPANRVGPSVDLPEPPLERALSEARFMRRVIEYAERRGWLCYHTHDSRRSRSGFPDTVLVRAGEILFAELKTDKGRPTPEQIVWLDALRETGAASGIWRPADWEAILRALR